MNIIRYKQSCFLIETNATRILIDPGTIDFDFELLKNEWTNLDAILVTHKHADHVHTEIISQLLENEKTTLYSTQEVKEQYPDLEISIVAVGENFKINDVEVEVTDAVHGFIPKLKEMSIEIKENVGYIIDDGETRFYHTSDCIGFANDYKCNVLAIPVNNHGLCFGAPDAVMFAQATGATTIIPCHYDNPVFPADMDAVTEAFKNADLNLKILDYKEEMEV